MKKRISFYIEPDLWAFAKWYAKRNATSAAQVIRDHLVNLRRFAISSGEYERNSVSKVTSDKSRA